MLLLAGADGGAYHRPGGERRAQRWSAPPGTAHPHDPAADNATASDCQQTHGSHLTHQRPLDLQRHPGLRGAPRHCHDVCQSTHTSGKVPVYLICDFW